MENTKEEIAKLEKIIAESLNSDEKNGDYEKYIQLAIYHINFAKNIKDYALSLEYAKKAVSHGYFEGYYILGQLYYYGTGCEQNIVRGLNYFTKFIEKYSDNDFLNENAIADSYKNLAEGYFKLGIYNKALKYYHDLKRIDPELAKNTRDIEEDIANIQKENGLLFLKVAFVFLLICIGLLYLSNRYGEYVRDFFTPSKSVVSVVTNEDISKKTSAFALLNSDSSTAISSSSKNKVVQFKLLESKEFFENVKGEITPTNVWASSEYISSIGNDYSANCLIDMDEETAWQEGTEGGGIGECLHFDFAEEETIAGFIITNGKIVTKDDYYNNNRLASFKIIPEEENNAIIINLEDKFGKQYVYFNEPMVTSSLDISIESVFSGLRFDDTCVTEIVFYK